jgi:hypothetical protein
MKAVELRIGNLVLNPHQKKVYTIQAIKPAYKLSRLRDGKWNYFVDVAEDTYSVTVDLFVGIPLTEEWLVKLGYTKNEECVCYELLNREDEIFSFWFSETELTLAGLGFKGLWPPVKYVHQLQNLYFALTGEELTVK